MTLALSAAAAAESAVPVVIPKPKSIQALPGERLILPQGKTAIVIGAKATEPERYAAETLQNDVKRWLGQSWPIVEETRGIAGYAAVIIIGQRSTNRLLDGLCTEWKIDLTEQSPGHDGYVIRSGRSEGRDVVLVGGSDARGVVFGQDTLFQTLSQTRVRGTKVVKSGGQDIYLHSEHNYIEMPRVSIRDWPSIPWRGKPQTSVARHLEPGVMDWYIRARMNYIDLRGGTYAFKPEDKLDEKQIKETITQAHRRGMFVYATVDCAVEKNRQDAVLGMFERFISLGVDGLWMSFDDLGPGENPETLVTRVLELGKAHDMTGQRIAVCPPKGSYQVVPGDFNRKIVRIPGMENALWFFTGVPYQENLEAARSIGLKSNLGWWHNWPKPPGIPQLADTARSHGFLLSCTGRKDGKPGYMPVPRVADGWHQATYESLRDAGSTTAAIMQWGGSGWKYEYTYPVLGWWGWDPEKHDWREVRGRIYRLVYGDRLADAAMEFDDAYRELSGYFIFSGSGNECEPQFPPLLRSESDRPAARKLAARMESAFAKLKTATPAESHVDGERLRGQFIDAAGAELATVKAAIELQYPEYWWDKHQRAVIAAVQQGDIARADALIRAARPKVTEQVKQVTSRLTQAARLDEYAKWWTDTAARDAKGWQEYLRKRQAEHKRRLDDFEYRKTGAFVYTVLKNLKSPPGDLSVVATVMPTGPEYFEGAWIGGGAEKNGLKYYAFTYPLKVFAHVGEYAEAQVVVPTTGPYGWRGLRFFLNTWTNDTIAFETITGRWLGRAFVQIRNGDKVLWEEDIAIPRGGGEWVTVSLPASEEDQKEMKLTIRVEQRMEALNYAAAVFVGPIDVVSVQR